MFSANDVKSLRDKTGAGMMDCKKALQESNGNMEDAITWLREKGISKAQKKESRIAAEGLSYAFSDGNKAIILEVNCETDFVARNEEFKTLVSNIASALLNSDVKTMEEANDVSLKDGTTISQAVVNFTAKIGEKISFRRFEKVSKEDGQVFGIYSHLGGKITTLVTLNGDNADVARDVAMHVAAMRPLCISSDEVPTDTLEKEKAIYKEQAINEGKPEDIAEKMVLGRIKKYYKEVCLNDQEFIKDTSVTVSQYAKNNNCSIVGMIRYEVGEGMEKRNDNFAEEVKNQING